MPLRAEVRGPLVLAAASLQEAMEDAADAWAGQKRPRPVVSVAGSSALARQIERGAPADLFLSADTQWMDYVAARGLVRRGSRAEFLSNRLVLIAPKGSKASLRIARDFPLARALGKRRLAIADPEAVPAGRYARAALAYLGVWSSVRRQLAPTADVRAALALVERGEAPFGIVYRTDARASGRVREVGMFPAGSHPPITYSVAVLTGSSHPQAQPFLRFLLSRDGRAIFARHGFAVR